MSISLEKIKEEIKLRLDSLKKKIESGHGAGEYCPELESLASILAKQIDNQKLKDAYESFDWALYEFVRIIRSYGPAQETPNITLAQRGYFEIRTLKNISEKLFEKIEETDSEKIKSLFQAPKQKGLKLVFSKIYEENCKSIRDIKERVTLSRQQIRNNLYMLDSIGMVSLEKDSQSTNSALHIELTCSGEFYGSILFGKSKPSESKAQKSILENGSTTQDSNWDPPVIAIRATS